MQFKFLIFALVAFLAMGFSSSHPSDPADAKCPENQEFKSCGTACPERCNEPKPEICTLQCIIGCQCKDGFVYNHENQCVKPADC